MTSNDASAFADRKPLARYGAIWERARLRLALLSFTNDSI
jgi:hypothetical protein